MGVGPASANRAVPAPAVAWNGSWALLGGLCSVPAVIVAFSDPTLGVALAVGVLPAAATGVLPRRRDRSACLVVGAAIGAGLVLGAALATHAVAAVVTIFLLCLGAAVLAGRLAVGRLLMVLAVPMVGAGLSFSDVGTAVGVAGVLVLGSAYGWLVALAWPAHDGPEPVRPRPQPSEVLLGYGVRLGLAGAVCAGVGFALDLDHKGWATAACLLVMRPTPELTRLRGAGRAGAVTVGALAAMLLAAADPPPAVVAVAICAALTGLAGTRASRWYVTGGFTTFLVILLLALTSPGTGPSRFGERVLETLLGVGVALVFGVLVPSLRQPHVPAEPGATGTAPP